VPPKKTKKQKNPVVSGLCPYSCLLKRQRSGGSSFKANKWFVRPYLQEKITKKDWWSGLRYSKPWVQTPVPQKKKNKILSSNLSVGGKGVGEACLFLVEGNYSPHRELSDFDFTDCMTLLLLLISILSGDVFLLLSPGCPGTHILHQLGL
jgi:hypothetical protein